MIDNGARIISLNLGRTQASLKGGLKHISANIKLYIALIAKSNHYFPTGEPREWIGMVVRSTSGFPRESEKTLPHPDPTHEFFSLAKRIRAGNEHLVPMTGHTLPGSASGVQEIPKLTAGTG